MQIRKGSVKEWLINNRNKYKTRKELCKACSESMGISYDSVRTKSYKIDLNPTETPRTEKPKVAEVSTDYREDTAVITTKSLDIRTKDQALKEAGVDLDEWEAERCVVNSWETTMSGTKSSTNKDQTYTNFQVKVWLKRKIKHTIQEAIENLINNYKPLPQKIIEYPVRKKRVKLEIGLNDHHFGLLSWHMETGVDYDLKIAENLFLNGVNDLLDKAAPYDIECIEFPIGNDFFHMSDNTNRTPRSGNMLDTDGRLAKIFEAGGAACTKAIERCLQIAPVTLKHIPGNHDENVSYFLCKWLEAYFHLDNRVSVDASPIARKYSRYGNTLIGYTHGSDEPWPRLATLMTDECGKDYVETNFHEFHVGHFHTKKEKFFWSSDSIGSMIVRVLRSLSASDVWHFRKGYVKRARACEAFLYDYKEGPIGYLNSNVVEL